MRYPGWLSSYMRYASYDHYPPNFHLACGMVLAGLATAGNVYGYYERWPVRPLPHFVFIANSGVGKGSTMALMHRVQEAALPDLAMIIDKMTSAGIYEHLVDGQPTLIEAEEMTTLFNHMESQGDIVPTLTQLADHRHVHKTLKTGRIRLNDTRCALLFGTSEAGLLKYFDTAIVQQGLACRMMWLSAQASKPVNKMPDEDVAEVVASKAEAVDGLKELAKQHGRQVRTDPATDWLIAFQREPPPLPDADQILDGYVSRRIRFINQYASISAICRGSMTVELDDVLWGADLLAEFEPQMLGIFERLSMSASGRNEGAILDWLACRGEYEDWTNESAIKARWHMKLAGSAHVERLLDSLWQAGKLDKRPSMKGGGRQWRVPVGEDSKNLVKIAGAESA